MLPIANIMGPKVIAICGLKRSGKDTAADFICESGYLKFRFADPLKHIIKYLFSFTDNEIEGSSKDVVHDKWQVKPRTLLQYIGTDVMQYGIQDIVPNIGRTFWAENLCERIKNETKVVIPDLRFVHEVDVLMKNFQDVCIIKVTRNTIQNDSDHVSESEFLNIKPRFEIKNNGSLEQLQKEIDICISQI